MSLKKDLDAEDNDLYYPKTSDIETWESFLNRELTVEEKLYLMDVIMEKDLNNELQNLQKNLLKDGSLCIPRLTNNVGNCLFESLQILELGDAEKIRKNIAAVMSICKSDSSFFPNLNISLEDIFRNSNDINYVLDKNDEQKYKYNYDMMLIDLYSKYSWSRLPAELILMVISRIYKIRILIYHNNTDYINEINIWKDIKDKDNKNVELKTIRLGQLNEEHYVPVAEIPDDYKLNTEIYNEFLNKKVKYVKAKNRFHKWARELVTQINDQNKIKIEKINQIHTALENDIKECDLTDFYNIS
jgi:hypothetical protein